MFPLEPIPHIQHHNTATWVDLPWQIPKALPLKQKNMAQMEEQIKAPKIELNDEEIANLSDAEFKTLVIRKLTEMVKYG